RFDESQVPQISYLSWNAVTAPATVVAARSEPSPYPLNVVSSYQMKLSCVFSAERDSLCWLANHVTLSLWLVSQRPPTDHCAMPRPGPPPICAMVGLMPDSCIRLPITPAAWTLVKPLLTKKLNAVCSLLDS